MTFMCLKKIGFAPRASSAASIGSKVLEGKLAFTVPKRTAATETEQVVVMCRRGFNAHYFVLRTAGRALELGRL
jgi:hypothetical protein